MARYQRNGGESNLKHAIDLHQEVLSLRPPGNPNRSSSLSNLANAVMARYRRGGEECDLLYDFDLTVSPGQGTHFVPGE